MRSGVLAGLCVAVVLVCVFQPQPCEAQWEAVVTALVDKISGLWVSDSVDFMGHTCNYRIRPTVNKWKLYYKGKFWCPGWASFSGTSRTKSRSGAVRDATQSFVRKALQTGLITETEANQWLQG